MTETDYLKECFAFYSRMMLAAFATLVVALGATIRMSVMLIAETDPALRETMMMLVNLGGVASALFVVLFVCFLICTAHKMRQLKRSTEDSQCLV